jgi:hypothetical protein
MGKGYNGNTLKVFYLHPSGKEDEWSAVESWVDSGYAVKGVTYASSFPQNIVVVLERKQ